MKAKLKPDITDRASDYMNRLNALSALGFSRRRTRLFGAQDIQAMIRTGGRPGDIAEAVLNGNLKGRMTLEGVDGLLNAMDPKQIKTPEEKATFIRQIDALPHALQDDMPVTPNRLPPSVTFPLADGPAVSEERAVVANGGAMTGEQARQYLQSHPPQQNQMQLPPRVGSIPSPAMGGPDPLDFLNPAQAAGHMFSMDPVDSMRRGQAATGSAATLGMGNIPTGDTAFDIGELGRELVDVQPD